MSLLIAQTIIALKDADLAMRDKLIAKHQLGDGYHEEMEQLHISNAVKLESIIDTIGYPTIEKVGQEASDAAWLVIQHAISKPTFMKKALTLLTAEADKDESYQRQMAYLSDRIAVFEDKPQLYGTQFDWDRHGELSPKPCDDIVKVDERRKAIGLNTLAEQTAIMRAQAKKENEFPPVNLEQRRQEIDLWRRRVGWL